MTMSPSETKEAIETAIKIYYAINGKHPDILAIGKEIEGAFGNFIHLITPDESIAIIAYLWEFEGVTPLSLREWNDWNDGMRENETDIEIRLIPKK